MKKQSLIILGIILAGSLTSIAYATSVTDTTSIFQSITTTSLTVSGTCTGCGAGEGSYSNYNTVILNTTIPISIGGIAPALFVSNNGTVLWDDNQNSFAITNTGAIIEHGSTNNFGISNQNAQSVSGEYKILQIANGTGSFIVIKNQSILQTLGINGNQFVSGINSISTAISPNGHYIVFGGRDAVLNNQRILIFQGS